MDQAAEKKIDNIFNVITGSCNDQSKLLAQDTRDAFEEIASQYEFMMDEESRKKTGSFYTDRSIIRFMVNKVLADVDVVANPYIRILDPSCGCGYFVSQAYDILKNKFVQNMNAVNLRYPDLKLCPENLHEHIIRYNIFGSDLDEYAVKLSIITIMMKEPGCRVIPNIICCDSIINWEDTFLEEKNFWSQKFHIIIGNPPYIGHKKMSGQYRKVLNSIYGDVFKDKADISYCFIKSSIDRLTVRGRLCFITSRYFLESPSGRALREYIKQKCNIEDIIDFYGVRIMKGISVDPVIIFFRKSDGCKKNMIEITKARIKLKDIEGDDIFYELEHKNKNYFVFFTINQERLHDSGWVLCTDEDMSIINKIESSLSVRLDDVCSSFQGIITGCDKAFVVNDSIIEEYGIERSIIRTWIKSSYIKKYEIENSSLYIIYSDSIDDIKKYKGAISHIDRYKSRLEKRRECLRGFRKWYQLQWGRDRLLFDGKKIVFPYKSSCSRFAIDEGSYSSADVYGMIIKEQYRHVLSYEFMVGILNSSLYEFYFKSMGKKLGDDMYDYYPNTVMRLKVPETEDAYITERVKYILNCGDEKKKLNAMYEIDRHLYKSFNLSDSQINVIERGILKK